MFGKTYTRRAAMALATSMAFCSASLAAYPDKPVSVIVGYAPGGSVDLVARIVSRMLGDEMGQSFVVENKPGANGNIAAQQVARAKADGYTLLFGGSNHVANDSLYKNLPFSFADDFLPVTLSASMSNVLVVSQKVAATNLAALIENAKQQPGALNYGSSGAGSSQHLSAKLLERMAGISLTHVAYRGAAPALTDVMAGNIDLMFVNAPTAAAQLNSGKLRPLAVTSAARDPAFPDIPTVAEQGLPGFTTEAWVGLFAPKGIPADVLRALQAAAERIAASPEFQRQIAEQTMRPLRMDPNQASAFVRAENKKWSTLSREAGISLD